MTAEVSLAQIQRVRQQAEGGLKVSLIDKHEREEVQIEEQNRLEFEEFTHAWDDKIQQLQAQAVEQMQNLRQSHAVQIQETRAYLEATMSAKFKPSADLLNLRKIE